MVDPRFSARFLPEVEGMSFYDKLKFDAQRIDSRHHPGTQNQARADDGVDEPRFAGKNRRHRQNAFLEPLAPEILDERRGSGHTQTVKDIAFDCDGDMLLIQVEQIGAACHEGYQSCFFRSVRMRRVISKSPNRNWKRRRKFTASGNG